MIRMKVMNVDVITLTTTPANLVFACISKLYKSLQLVASFVMNDMNEIVQTDGVNKQSKTNDSTALPLMNLLLLMFFYSFAVVNHFVDIITT